MLNYGLIFKMDDYLRFNLFSNICVYEKEGDEYLLYLFFGMFFLI